ncbi:nicotianamine synthase family protein [Fictibacillus aquaticus]|uniref:Methyltransferase domain-containing protein n=1 Tax=Fictibacillus aquaticus TaxID=2021314 RepID=A0A235FEA7_9BACL|nr:nicotianamine synthase family protein [Fictibacillus aquaticus]OYD59313.1 hypothetical protein CGZ90_05320 [Fictibacillus aquaticus]
MKERFELLLSLKTLEYEINELLIFSKECEECFDLLQEKLDSLHQFMTCEDNVSRWDSWGTDELIVSHSEKVRDASVRAACSMEKHQSKRSCNHELNVSEYIETLASTVKNELEEFGVDGSSKVVFIGSGAFPISALTIASEKGAAVCCIDIDQEALILGRKVAELTGLQSAVTFTSEKADEVPFTAEATHIFIASLVNNKKDVLNGLRKAVQPSAKIILRYGNGLKSIFNYPFERDNLNDWSVASSERGEGIYDTVLLKKKIHTSTIVI